jgi:AcrR family transcriptional regulator
VNFNEFKQSVDTSFESLCVELFRENRSAIKIGKESLAVKNLAKILKAALKLCIKKGFAAMSMRDLSREAGMSMGGLYRYFTNKEELLRLMQSQGRKTVLRILTQGMEGLTDPRTKLRRFLKIHLFLSELMRPWFYISYMEARSFPGDEYKKAIDAELFTENIVTETITDGSKKKLFHTANPELVASLVKALLQDWYLKRRKYSDRNISVDEYADFLIDFIESSLLCVKDEGVHSK